MVKRPDMTLRFAIADDHAMFRAGLRLLLEDSFQGCTVEEAASLSELEELLAGDDDFDLVMADLRMPGMNGGQTFARLRAGFPRVRIIAISGSEDRQDVLDVLGAGAFGFVPKALDPEPMVAAFRQVMAGGVYAPSLLAQTPMEMHPRPAAALAPAPPPQDGPATALLTPRQRDVLRLLEAGRSNKEIARALDISEGTVKIHLAAVFRLLDARNRTEAVLKARELLP
jgi:DNA-binding NarL/FixJ family response regulator